MDIKFTGDPKTDFALKEIKEKAQGRNFLIKNGVPSNSEGGIGNIWIVNDSGSYYLYVKVANNVWKKTALT